MLLSVINHVGSPQHWSSTGGMSAPANAPLVPSAQLDLDCSHLQSFGLLDGGDVNGDMTGGGVSG